MKTNILRNLGTFNIEQLEVIGGQLEIFIPVEVTSKELDAVLEKCENRYREQHPEVKEITFNINLVFSMGYANPEFELQILVYDDVSENIIEEYDSFIVGNIELSADQKKQIKKVMWDKMGEMLFDL